MLLLPLFYRNERTVFLASTESYPAINQCIQRMIFTDTYVLTRMMNCSSLTNDDVTSFSNLTTEKLNT